MLTPAPDPSPSHLGSEDRWGGALAAVFAGLLALPWFVHAAVVLASVLGAHPLAIRGSAAGILLFAALFSLVLAMRVARRRPAARGSAEASAQVIPALARAASSTLAIAAIATLVAAALAAVLLPFVAYDALSYRLPVISQWLDAGRIAWVATDDPVRNGYPMGQEAVAAVVAALAGSLRLTSLTSFLHVATGALAIWMLAERCGVPRPLARAAASIFPLTPMVILNAPSGYVDAAFGGATIALFCTSAWLVNAPRADAVLGAATGMCAANALALKGTGLLFVGLVAGVLFTHTLVRWLRRKPVPWLALILAVVCTLPGTFWVVRNVLRTGNPLWPVQVKLGGHVLLPGVGSMDYILDTANNTPAAFVPLGTFARLLRTWFEWRGPAVDFDDRMAGLGLAWPLLALPAIVAFGIRFATERDPKRRRVQGCIGFVLLLTVGCFVLQPMSWWPRYTLWIWGAGALAIGTLAESLFAKGRGHMLGFFMAAVAVMCVTEGVMALTHAKDAKTAISRYMQRDPARPGFTDTRHAINAAWWVAPEFWELGIERHEDVCRGWWKPHTDNPNLDGVFAQLTPRPRLHVFYDNDGNWTRVRSAWRASHCAELLLLLGSPVLSSAEQDPSVSVKRAVAFDPLFIVRPRSTVGFDRFEDLQP